MAQHCGKHDKIFTEEKPCPGCETEAAGGSTTIGSPPLVGPDDTISELRGHGEEFETPEQHSKHSGKKRREH